MAERVALIIPALNEEQSLPGVLAEIAQTAMLGGSAGPTQVIVVDNGSTDRTAEVARVLGAQVVSEPRRGYGRACLAGIDAAGSDASFIAFMDADGSDAPADLRHLLTPIANGEADLVIGSRVLGERQQDSLSLQQRFGNRLATWLLRLLYNARYTDLGPFRAIRREALLRLAMRDTNFGWTIEMQIKAHQQGLRVLEVPVRHRRRRGGESKISGSFRGSLLAGLKIIWTILRYRFSL